MPNRPSNDKLDCRFDAVPLVMRLEGWVVDANCDQNRFCVAWNLVGRERVAAHFLILNDECSVGILDVYGKLFYWRFRRSSVDDIDRHGIVVRRRR